MSKPPIQDRAGFEWLRPFEQLWSDRFSRLDDVVAESTESDEFTDTQGDRHE